MRRRRITPRFSVSLLVMVGCLLTGATPASVDFSGDYVLLQRSTTRSYIPVLPDFRSEMRAVSLHRATHVGDRFSTQGKLCSVQMVSSTSLIRTELPVALQRVLPPTGLDAHLIRRGSAVQFRQPSRTVVLGARLKDRERDALPTRASDSRVFDQDGDGQPGVTVNVFGLVKGQVYVAQRAKSELLGQQVGENFSGKVRFSTEDAVLGATSSTLMKRTDTRPDPERSDFRLVRLRGKATCQAALALAQDEGW